MPDRPVLLPVEWMGSALRDLDDFDGDAYRAVYTLKLKGAVYVLHVFQKKSTHGVSTPLHIVDVIKQRLALAREHYAINYASKDPR